MTSPNKKTMSLHHDGLEGGERIEGVERRNAQQNSGVPCEQSSTADNQLSSKPFSQADDSHDDKQNQIRCARDVLEAFKLTWEKQKAHLFTSWIHVPLGVMFLLTITWGFRLAIDQAPFRFPAPVIAMILFFAILLFLDWMSNRFPGQTHQEKDVEKEAASERQHLHHHRKRFVDPFMAFLAPPCEFLLRNMSVMFTPSFILIPAREVIPGKEIGLIAAWFTISQVIAFVFPVLFIWGLNWVTAKGKRMLKSSLPSPPIHGPTSSSSSRRASLATIAGVDWEKGKSFQGGNKLGVVATGLSGMTVNVIAPISHVQMDVDQDSWRQIESTAIEQARQQGVPAVTNWSSSSDDQQPHFVYRNYSPRSDVSSFHHNHHHHRHHRNGDLIHRLERTGRSLSHRGDRSQSQSPDANNPTRKRIKRSDSTPPPSADYRFPFSDPFLAVGVVEEEQEAVQPCSKEMPEIDVIEEDADVETRRPSKVTFNTNPKQAEATPSNQEKDESTNNASQVSDGQGSSCHSQEEDAIERLSSWMSDLITPTIYFIIFLIGIPLFYAADIALPLFLGVNILTFIAAITIVPPRIRRFLHPILSCSITTVLIIWAFAAIKGISLKDCLNRYYSIETRYIQLWSPKGYIGGVPGAGDVLFSTLDAGIVALAIPMYRFRKELKDNLGKMMMVLLPCASLSLFFYNSIAALMGMDQVRSLAFTARFMSTPLAIELAANIGADQSITVILVVITGIIAAILKDPFFRLMKVDKEDYMVIGLTMGSTAGAIGASSLISTPRVMAVASLSFVLFGSILLVATAIPPIVEIVRMLA